MFRLSPGLFGGFLAIRSRKICERAEHHHGLDLLSARLVAHHGRTVLNGPFQGMRIPKAMDKRHIGPFLFGSYESALHGPIRSLNSRKFSVVIDIGSSFGYYALGFARMFPTATIFSFDTDPWARAAVREGARLNGCTNLVVRGACTPSILQSIPNDRTLIISDCEGYERTLFAETPAELLKSCDMIIELHPAGDSNVARALRRHFEDTHTAELIDHVSPNPRGTFDLLDVPARAYTELRSLDQQWLLLRAKS